MDKLDKFLINITAVAVGFFGGAMLAAYAVADDNDGFKVDLPQQGPIVIEIERNLPDDKSFLIRREFNDLEDLLMWFENKVDHEGCDPYVDKVILYPKGQD
jgi:hypothetical protein